MRVVTIDGRSLTLADVCYVAHAQKGRVVALDPRGKRSLESSRSFILDVVDQGETIYGVNTGFGALANTPIDKDEIGILQMNLIRSHCTGVGKPFSREITRAIMFLRANCLVSGYSGVSLEAVELLIEFLNNDVVPVVAEKGSVGASGDLAPLAQIALCLIGEGKVVYGGRVMDSLVALEQIGRKPITLGPKDGLALINGTAVMAALGVLALEEAHSLARHADLAAAMTLDAIKGTAKAYDPKISALRPHPGQVTVCKNLNKILHGSEILLSHADCDKVQDPYSLRCVPQVHGASRQVISHAEDVLAVEINSVTDNPLVFIEEKEVLSGGNFHGQCLAFAMDYLAMGISELGSISERRIDKMMNKEFSQLPPFLAPKGGLCSGLMITQYTAAELASENKILCHPASIDSIPTSTDKEDHVSMGVTAGRKLYDIIFNVRHILAIEFLCNSQAIALQRPLRSSLAIEECYDVIRRNTDNIDDDRVFNIDIENIVGLMRSEELILSVEKHIGELV